MNMQFKPRLFTVDEYMTLGNQGLFDRDAGGVELRDGQIIRTSPG